MADRENIVVVGAGAAGTSIARQLSTTLDHTKHKLILISPRPYLVYYPAIIRALVGPDPFNQDISTTASADATAPTSPTKDPATDTKTNSITDTVAELPKGDDGEKPNPGAETDSAKPKLSPEDEFFGKAFIPLDGLFHNGHGQLMVGKVTSIVDEGPHGGHVVLEDGTKVTWSVLVVAPGSAWEGPFAFPEGPREQSIQHLRQWRKTFKRARNIVIAGGGAVGVELATELKDRYPEKDVTVVHSQDMPLNDTYPEKWRKMLHSRMRKLQIKTVYNDSIDELRTEYNAVLTKNGELLLTDLLVPCRGGKMNTEFISTLGEKVLWSSGCVRINPGFQLLFNKRIFAAGDVIEWEEQKQYAKALSHADMVAKNVISAIRREDMACIYKGSPEVISLTMGEGRGVTYFSYLWGLQFGDMFTTTYKSKFADIEYAREQLGCQSTTA